MNQPTQPQACGYSIDADPQGIRALTADAIHGALAFGFQGVNPPPEGHWLTMFWQIGRDAQAARPPVKTDCEHCGGTGEVLAHAENCHDDLCALNGDEHSCVGHVEPCSCAAQPAAPTLMTEAQAGKWAWSQVREEVGTEGWTTGDSCNFFGFFMHGWRYRGQYELQRRAALSMAVPVEQPAAAEPAYADSTPHLSVGDSSFESWWSSYLLHAPVHQGAKQKARDAYAAGMGDPLVTAAPVQKSTITLTLEQARTLAEALDIGLGAAGAAAANYHEAIKGYRPEQHKAMDEDAAKVNGALTMLSGLIQVATGEEEVEHG